jgi:glycosyltransferase involved in cell wall biosynthesis
MFQGVEKRIVILGPSIRTKGGISTVIRLHISAISGHFPVTVIPTYRGESWIEDFFLFLVCIIRTGWLCLFLTPGNVLFHIHASTGGSYFRKGILARLLQLRGHSYLFHIHAGNFDTFIRLENRKTTLNPLLRAKKVLIVSESWAERIAELLPELHNLTVLHNPGPFDVMPVKASSRDNSVTRLIYTGRIIDRKGSYDLIRACALIRDLPFTLDLCGDGEVKLASDMILELGLADKIHVYDWVDMKDVAAFYGRYDIFMLPSWLEGLAMSALEAISCSLPIIATNILGMDTCVHNEENGLLVPTKDPPALSRAMERLIMDRDLQARMGTASRRLAEALFTPSFIGNRLVDIYHEALGDDA